MPVGAEPIPSQLHPDIGHHSLHIPSPIEPGRGTEVNIEEGK